MREMDWEERDVKVKSFKYKGELFSCFLDKGGGAKI